MNVIEENVIENAMNKLEPFVEEAIGSLSEKGTQIIESVKKDYLPLLEDLVKNFTGEIKGIAFGKEVVLLDMQALVDMAKKYVVPKSNEIVAIKVKQEDCYFIYLAYSENRHLLPVAENKYIIIKAQTLAKEVEELFSESELVILK